MRLWFLLYGGFAAFVLLFFYCIVDDASNGRPFLSFLRSKRRREVEQSLAKVHEELDIEAAESEVEQLAKGLRKKPENETKVAT